MNNRHRNRYKATKLRDKNLPFFKRLIKEFSAQFLSLASLFIMAFIEREINRSK